MCSDSSALGRHTAFYQGVDTVVSGGCVRFHDLRWMLGCTVVLIIGIRINMFCIYPRALPPLSARVSHRSRQKFREDRATVKTDDRHVCILFPSPINYVKALRNPKKKLKRDTTVYNKYIYRYILSCII